MQHGWIWPTAIGCLLAGAAPSTSLGVCILHSAVTRHVWLWKWDQYEEELNFNIEF